MSLFTEPFALARLFRTSCPLCSSTDLAWMCAHSAASRVGTFQWIALAARFPVELRDQLEVWQCRSCYEIGAFSPAEIVDA